MRKVFPRFSGYAEKLKEPRISKRSAISLKSLGQLLKVLPMKYAFIDEYSSGVRVKKVCHVLDISRSRYYARRRCSTGRWEQENERLPEKGTRKPI